eukprot:2110143-Pyramimonas_sp.AAC.1
MKRVMGYITRREFNTGPPCLPRLSAEKAALQSHTTLLEVVQSPLPPPTPPLCFLVLGSSDVGGARRGDVVGTRSDESGT